MHGLPTEEQQTSELFQKHPLSSWIEMISVPYRTCDRANMLKLNAQGKSYLKVMNWVTHKASELFKQTGKLTVIVQDNSPIHTH